MGARRRVRQTGKSVPSQAVHARHNQHEPSYTFQQFRAEQAVIEQEQLDIYLAMQRKYGVEPEPKQESAAA